MDTTHIKTKVTSCVVGQQRQPSTTPAPSTVLLKLADAHRKHNAQPEESTVSRTTAFSDAPAVAPSGTTTAPERDDRLALIEDIPMGSAEHTAPFDDPHFEKLEPNSGIRLA